MCVFRKLHTHDCALHRPCRNSLAASVQSAVSRAVWNIACLRAMPLSYRECRRLFDLTRLIFLATTKFNRIIMHRCSCDVIHMWLDVTVISKIVICSCSCFLWIFGTHVYFYIAHVYHYLIIAVYKKIRIKWKDHNIYTKDSNNPLFFYEMQCLRDQFLIRYGISLFSVICLPPSQFLFL